MTELKPIVPELVREANAKAHTALKDQYTEYFQMYDRQGALTLGMERVASAVKALVGINRVLTERVPHPVDRIKTKKDGTEGITQSIKNRVIAPGNQLVLHLKEYIKTKDGMKDMKTVEKSYGGGFCVTDTDHGEIIIFDRKTLNHMVASVLHQSKTLAKSFATGRRRSGNVVWSKVNEAFIDYAKEVIKEAGIKGDFKALEAGYVSRFLYSQLAVIDKNQSRAGSKKMTPLMKELFAKNCSRTYTKPELAKTSVNVRVRQGVIPKGSDRYGPYNKEGKKVRDTQERVTIPVIKIKTVGSSKAGSALVEYNKKVGIYNKQVKDAIAGYDAVVKSYEDHKDHKGHKDGDRIMQALNDKRDGLLSSGKTGKRSSYYAKKDTIESDSNVGQAALTTLFSLYVQDKEGSDVTEGTKMLNAIKKEYEAVARKAKPISEANNKAAKDKKASPAEKTAKRRANTVERSENRAVRSRSIGRE